MDTDIISFRSDEEELKYRWERACVLRKITREGNDSASSLPMRELYTIVKRQQKEKLNVHIPNTKAFQQEILVHLKKKQREIVRHQMNVLRLMKNRHVKNLYLKLEKGKENTERQSSSSRGSTTDVEQPFKKRRYIKRKKKTRAEIEDTESESSSSKESSASDGEVLSNIPQIMNIQNKSRVTKGNEKQPTKFPTGGKSSPKNQFQKSFDDTRTQSIVEELSIEMKSVGVLVSRGDPAGTVFFVGDKYVMTAYHVINGIPENYLFENKETFVNFNESPYTPVVIFTIKRKVFHDEALDVTVLEVCNTEGLPKGLKLSNHGCTDFDKMLIIGYGHPNQHKKTLEPCCPVIKADSPRISYAKEWLETQRNDHKRILKGTGHNPSIVDVGFGNLNDSNRFIIESFMEQGVSGAPALVAREKNGQMEVSGLMTHGIPEVFYLLPKLVTSGGFPHEHRFASGTTMKAIYSSIRTDNSELANNLFK